MTISKINTIICKDYNEMSKIASDMICKEINSNPNLTLGLATGSTPIGTYKNLVESYKKGLVNFNNIKTFNLDEYYGLSKDNKQSYDYFMKEHLFNHININKENIHIPNGLAENIDYECKNYDKLILDNNGIDVQLLGIGSNSHIAFNEPSHAFKVGTSLVDLTESTIEANSRFFKNKEDVPTKAISMGIGSIFEAKKIILLASGKSKAQAVYNTLNGDINPNIPSSILKLHNNVTLIIDEESASLLQQ